MKSKLMAYVLVFSFCILNVGFFAITDSDSTTLSLETATTSSLTVTELDNLSQKDLRTGFDYTDAIKCTMSANSSKGFIVVFSSQNAGNLIHSSSYAAYKPGTFVGYTIRMSQEGFLGGSLDVPMSEYTDKTFATTAVYLVNLVPTEATVDWSVILSIKVASNNEQLLDGSYWDSITVTLINV